MTGLGIVATGAAILNYQRAKKNYDQAYERAEGVLSVIERYQEIIDEWDYRQNPPEIKEYEKNERPEGLHVGVMLRVGNLVGQLMRAEATVVLSNTGKDAIYIRTVDVSTSIFGCPVVEIGKTRYVNKILDPGKTLEIVFDKGVTSLVDENGNIDLTPLRNAICEKAGKKLITSCPRVNLDGVVTSIVVIDWLNPQDTEEKITYRAHLENPDIDFGKYFGKLGKPNHKPDDEPAEQYKGIAKKAWWSGYPGTLRYCGEAFL